MEGGRANGERQAGDRGIDREVGRQGGDSGGMEGERKEGEWREGGGRRAKRGKEGSGRGGEEGIGPNLPYATLQ